MRPLLLICSLIAFLASACTGAGVTTGKVDWHDPEYDLVWPAAPDEPRIKFLRTIRGPKDFGTEEKSGKLFAWLFGEKEEELPLLSPFAVAADGNGLVWVADTGSHLLYIFNLTKKSVDYIQQINNRQLEYPTGLAFDPQKNRIYLADSARNFIYVLNRDGDFVAEWQPPGGFKRPAGLTVDQTGNLYVADALEGYVFVFDSDGRYLRKIGSQLSETGRYERPVNVAVGPNGEVLVVDAMSFQVEVQSASGESLGIIGRLGDSAGYFARPKGLAVSQQGYVYISDSAFDNIQVFDMAGTLLMYFGSAGKSVGSFNLPAGLFVDLAGRLYVADPYNQRVQVFQILR